MSKNILFFSHSAELGGAELMLLQTLEKIDRQKFAPHLVVPRQGPLIQKVEKWGIKTDIIPSKWWLTEKKNIWKQPISWLWSIKSVFRIKNKIKEYKIDLVFSNSVASFSGAFAAQMTKIPHVWAVHETIGEKNSLLYFLFGKRRLVKLISRLSAGIIVNSRESRKAFPIQEKVHLVYNGVESNPTAGCSEDDLKKSFGLKKENIVLGIVGKIYREKGQEEAIMAVNGLKNLFPGLKLLVVGGVRDRRFFNHLQGLINKHGLENLVIFTGFRADALDILRIMDLLLVLSRVDSFGRVVIEAMSVNTPVLALSSGGFPEIIKHGENGYLLDSLAPENIQKAASAILEDKKMTASVVRKGFETVRTKFNIREMVLQIENILEDRVYRNR